MQVLRSNVTLLERSKNVSCHFQNYFNLASFYSFTFIVCHAAFLRNIIHKNLHEWHLKHLTVQISLWVREEGGCKDTILFP